MEPWLPFVASCYCAGQLCQATNLKSNITSSHCLASWWRMHLCSSSVLRTYRTKSMYVIWFICKLSSWAMQWCVHSQLYQSHLRKATLYCSIVAGFNPQLNHSLLIMISLRSSDSLLQTQSDDVSRKSLSISALLFLLMICLSYLVWTYMLVPYELACSYEVLGLTGWPDRLA